MKKPYTVLYLDNENDFFGKELAHGFIKEANLHKWWNHWYHPFDESNSASIISLVKQVQGVVFRGSNPDLQHYLETNNIPHVRIRAKEHSEEPHTPHVDDTLIGELARQEMDRLDVIHRGFIGYKDVTWSVRRGAAYFQDNKDSSYLALTEQEYSTSLGVRNIIQWLRDLPKPAGVFTSNDNLGVATLIACQLSGLKVPDQIAVIGVDNNIDRCDSVSPTLSSIDLRPQELGKHLAHLLAQRMNILEASDGEDPKILPPTLVVRESSHNLNPYLIHYRKSVEWIYRHALRGPSVQDLADNANISKRALERAFKQNNAPAPAQVIRQERMRQIRDLLLRDNVSQQHIANQASFPDIPSLSNFVKRQTGMTPGEIRKQGQ